MLELRGLVNTQDILDNFFPQQQQQQQGRQQKTKSEGGREFFVVFTYILVLFLFVYVYTCIYATKNNNNMARIKEVLPDQQEGGQPGPCHKAAHPGGPGPRRGGKLVIAANGPPTTW